MDHFIAKNGEIHAEDVALSSIAHAIGTPFYCYSTATLNRHVDVLREALLPLSPLICFAVKANSNLAVLRTLGNAGTGADVVSEGEIRAALAAGISPQKIIFSGVGKTRSEMRFALQQNIFQFNVESDRELLVLNDEATSLGVKAAIAIRVNPDVDAATHAKISTGKKENKFGVDIDVAPELYALAATLSHIRIQGVSMHIGSQLTQLAPFEAAYARARKLVEDLRVAGHTITTLDIGGGLGVPYHEDSSAPPLPASYGALIKRIFSGLDVKLILEPGRLIVGNAGILVSRVIYNKRTPTRTYMIIDAAMNDLMRPALYDAYHDISPVVDNGNAPELVDIVGPVCETGDTFALQRSIALPEEGALVMFRTAGAYGASMSNSYNNRPLIPEVLVHGDKFAIIRPRQTYEDMLARNQFAPWQ